MSRQNLVIAVLSCLLLVTAGRPAAGKDKSLLRLDVRGKTLEGKAVAGDSRNFWLMSRDGRLQELSFREVKNFEKLSTSFRGFSAVEIRDRLKREFGSGFEVTAKGRYVVCGPRGRAREYAKLFDGIYNRFYAYFRARQFRLKTPAFPLVALVFPDHQGFARYAAGDGVQASRGLMGYYHPHTNWVALFDPGNRSASTEQSPLTETEAVLLGSRSPSRRLLSPEIFARTGSSERGLRDTMIHEATHQIAFNAGLHTRIGQNPKWIVEGLATVYEAPGIRNSSTHNKPADRINRERFDWFMRFAQTRRQKGSLAAFISDDRKFNARVLDGYSQAWALSYYLIETRSHAYAKYLRKVAQRDPLKKYSTQERLEDFQKAFGKDLAVLDASFMRFMKKLAATTKF